MSDPGMLDDFYNFIFAKKTGKSFMGDGEEVN